MKIGIIGCGWLGFRLAKHLSSKNNKIYVTTTSVEKITELNSLFHSFLINFDNFETKKWEILSELDVIIITIPFAKHLEDDFLKNRLKNLQCFISEFKNQLFFTSSVGIYPSIDAEVDEKFPIGSLQSELFFSENLIKKHFPQVNLLRLGGLMGDNRIFSNYKVTNVHQVVNHVHYQDVCLAIETMILQKTHAKTYNIVAPLHPTKQEIINYQKGTNTALTEPPSGKIVSSKKMENELNFQFSFPNPIYF